MAASDYVSIFFKNRLHLVGRPQMSTRPSCVTQIASPGNRRRSSSLMLLLVAQQSSLLVPYLEAVPIGDVMVRAQCLGGFKR
jgi:hypothetical protein